jgi:hypothetical protein
MWLGRGTGPPALLIVVTVLGGCLTAPAPHREALSVITSGFVLKSMIVS